MTDKAKNVSQPKDYPHLAWEIANPVWWCARELPELVKYQRLG